jgi:nicotinamidase-related amidase
MNDPFLFRLRLRTQVLTADAGGHARWQARTRVLSVPAPEVALLLCDVWDNHWSRGAVERVNAMAPRMNAAVRAARERGALIIHAPSETMPFYAGTPARERLARGARVAPPPALDHPDPPLPIDDSDGGSDTGEIPTHTGWTRQHAAIEIDQDRDGISDDGAEIYSFLRARSVRQLLILGVHTNMCVLNRSFAIKQMVRWGQPVALVRDLTDAMYNPAMRPYVSHREGTRLVVEYIEKFWCPTVLSRDLLGE